MTDHFLDATEDAEMRAQDKRKECRFGGNCQLQVDFDGTARCALCKYDSRNEGFEND